MFLIHFIPGQILASKKGFEFPLHYGNRILSPQLAVPSCNSLCLVQALLGNSRIHLVSFDNDTSRQFGRLNVGKNDWISGRAGDGRRLQNKKPIKLCPCVDGITMPLSYTDQGFALLPASKPLSL